MPRAHNQGNRSNINCATQNDPTSDKRRYLRLGAGANGRSRGSATGRLCSLSAHRYVEQFEVPSWDEHERQHEGRLTADDKVIENAAFAHIVVRPQTKHLLLATARVSNDDVSR